MTDLSDLSEDARSAEPELYRSGRRKRAAERRRRWGAYAAGLVVVALAASLADWDAVQHNFFNWPRFRRQFPEVVTIAAKNTVIYTVCSFVGGVVLGTTVALLRLSSIRAYRWFATIYIELFRGLPALLTITLVGVVLPIAFGIRFPRPFGVPTAGIIALSLVAGAYLAETIRAGVQAVPKGQIEAARSLGMSHVTTMRRIVLPQAFRIVVPPLTNELVLLIKDTSLLSALGFTVAQKELTKFSRDAAVDTFNATPIVAAGLMYLMITIPLSQIVAYMERRSEHTR